MAVRVVCGQSNLVLERHSRSLCAGVAMTGGAFCSIVVSRPHQATHNHSVVQAMVPLYWHFWNLAHDCTRGGRGGEGMYIVHISF